MKQLTATLLALALTLSAVAADQTHKRNRKAKSAPVSLALARKAELGNMVGTWTLRDGDAPRKDIRMVFHTDGSFAFVGPNWKSAGHFHVESRQLCLEWTSVDGEKVGAGTMKKAYGIAEDGGSFTIDRYTYFKL